MKSPGPMSGALEVRACAHRDRSVLGDHRRAAEAVVDAELHDMDLLVDVEVLEADERSPDCLGAEIHVVVFALDRPVLVERELEAGTDHPTPAGLLTLKIYPTVV